MKTGINMSRVMRKRVFAFLTRSHKTLQAVQPQKIFGLKKYIIYIVAKIKVLINCTVTARLIYMPLFSL